MINMCVCVHTHMHMHAYSPKHFKLKLLQNKRQRKNLEGRQRKRHALYTKKIITEISCQKSSTMEENGVIFLKC